MSRLHAVPAALTLDEIRSWPPTVDVPAAARALGISRSHAFELAKRGAMPVKVLRVGTRYRVVTSSLLALLDDGGAASPRTA